MANVSAVKALTNYFNPPGEGHKPAAEWLKEYKALSDEEKRELALGVCVITGDTLV